MRGAVFQNFFDKAVYLFSLLLQEKLVETLKCGSALEPLHCFVPKGSWLHYCILVSRKFMKAKSFGEKWVYKFPKSVTIGILPKGKKAEVTQFTITVTVHYIMWTPQLFAII